MDPINKNIFFKCFYVTLLLFYMCSYGLLIHKILGICEYGHYLTIVGR